MSKFSSNNYHKYGVMHPTLQRLNKPTACQIYKKACEEKKCEEHCHIERPVLKRCDATLFQQEELTSNENEIISPIFFELPIIEEKSEEKSVEMCDVYECNDIIVENVVRKKPAPLFVNTNIFLKRTKKSLF